MLPKDYDMSSKGPAEKRKEQNRRAQANHRKKRQQRLRELEQRCALWDCLSSAASDSIVSGFETNKQPADGHGQTHLPEKSRRDACNDPSLQTIDNFQVAGLPQLDEPFQPAYLEELHFHNTSINYGFDFNAPEYADSTSNAAISFPASTKTTLAYTFDALATNAKLLGYSKEALINSESGSQFFSPLSSFDSPSIPRAFRPTMAQLTYQHHPYIDCVPLSELRSRIVLALSHRPPLVQHLEIWYDVLSGGLVPGVATDESPGWRLSEAFKSKWKNILTCDMGTLLAQTLSSNPPVRVAFPNVLEPEL